MHGAMGRGDWMNRGTLAGDEVWPLRRREWTCSCGLGQFGMVRCWQAAERAGVGLAGTGATGGAWANAEAQKVATGVSKREHLNEDDDNEHHGGAHSSEGADAGENDH